MSDVIIKKYDDVYAKIICSPEIATQFGENFTLIVPNYKYNKLYLQGKWDGRIRLFNKKTHLIYKGLVNNVGRYCKHQGISYDIHESLINTNYDSKEVRAFTNELDTRLYDKNGDHIYFRDYQLEAIEHAITKQNSLIVSPTGSGKSIIIYSVMRYIQLVQTRKILIVVPTVGLVSQLVSDFGEYSLKDDTWDVDESCHKICQGADKNTDKDVVISTYQSLMKMPKSYFKQYGAIFIDEAHQAKANSIKHILESLTDCPYRVGTTATVEDIPTDKLVLQGLLGPIKKTSSIKGLMDEGLLASLIVRNVFLTYPDNVKDTILKLVGRGQFKYQDEIDFLCANDRRNELITNLAVHNKKMTLILVQYVIKHGDLLWDKLQRKANGRPIYYIHQGVSAEERENIRRKVEHEPDAIILATYGTFQLGVNIKNIHNIIFAHPTKSMTRILQSLGRGLRVSAEKSSIRLFDIIDDLRYLSYTNYGIIHHTKRMVIYLREKFKIKRTVIKLYD